MTHARAVVMSAAETVAVRDIELTPALATDVTIQTLYTSISAGTERMLYAGHMPHPMLQFPVIPGYETVGRVIAVGAEAPATLLNTIVYVGGARCYVDVNPAWGGQSSVLHADGQRVVTLEGIKPEHGVFLALAATALHGVDMAGDISGKRVLILGQGPVGQLAARIASARGAHVIVSDVHAERLAHARAEKVCDVSTQSLSSYGVADCDVIIEASGKMDAAASAIGALALNGTIVLLGYYDAIQLPYMPLFLKQARLLTSKEWAPGDLQRSRDLMQSGILDVSTLITHHATLDQISTAYTTALFDPHCLKLLLTW
jgi:3-hydroxyethyl bacteriochlorophyllide a dehydrogenase